MHENRYSTQIFNMYITHTWVFISDLTINRKILGTVLLFYVVTLNRSFVSHNTQTNKFKATAWEL